MTDPIQTAEAAVAKGETELGFVEANWGKLSAIIVLAFVGGFFVGHII